MVDPTELSKAEQKRRAGEGKKRYGLSYLFGLLGGMLGGLPFFLFYLGLELRSFPFLILVGAGVYVIYLYFIDVNERNNKQIIFLILADVTAVILTLFFFILVTLHKTGAGVTLKNVIDAYFNNRQSVGNWLDYTLFFHLVALFFSAIGFVLVWLYIRFAVPRWEKKHGKTEEGTTGYGSKKKGKKVSGMK
jgi:signal transduction histidine kinase